MKFDRGLFQIVRKPTLNTFGVTKDRSMTEGVLSAAHRISGKLEGAQIGNVPV